MHMYKYLHGQNDIFNVLVLLFCTGMFKICWVFTKDPSSCRVCGCCVLQMFLNGTVRARGSDVGRLLPSRLLGKDWMCWGKRSATSKRCSKWQLLPWVPPPNLCFRSSGMVLVLWHALKPVRQKFTASITSRLSIGDPFISRLHFSVYILI